MSSEKSRKSSKNNKQLLPHQKEVLERVVKKCHDLRGIFLYHDMGSGKTLTTLNLYLNFRNYDMIIFCDENIKSVWKKNIEEYLIPLVKNNTNLKNIFDEKICIQTYNDLLDLKTPELLLNKFVVVDEAHNILKILRKKNDIMLVNNLINKLRISYKNIFLSGTPFNTSTMDLFILINFLKSYYTGKGLTFVNDDFSQDNFNIKFRYISQKKQISSAISLYLIAILENKKYKQVQDFLIRFFSEKLIDNFFKNSSKIFKEFISTFGVLQISSQIIQSIIRIWKKINEKSSFKFNLLINNKFENKNQEEFFEKYLNYIDYFKISENKDVFNGYPTKEFITENIYYNKFQIEQFLYILYNVKISKNDQHVVSNSSQLYHNIIMDDIEYEYLKNGRMIGNMKDNNENNDVWPEKFVKLYDTYINNIKNKNNKHVIYSNYYENGVLLLKKFFEHKNLNFDILFPIDDLNNTKKNDFDEKINNYNSGQNKILILHPDITEGISLKDTQYLHILEPILDLTIHKQVIGRVTRIDSHKKNKNLVKIVQWVCVNDSFANIFKNFFTRFNIWRKFFSYKLDINTFTLPSITPDSFVLKRSNDIEEFEKEFETICKAFFQNKKPEQNIEDIEEIQLYDEKELKNLKKDALCLGKDNYLKCQLNTTFDFDPNNTNNTNPKCYKMFHTKIKFDQIVDQRVKKIQEENENRNLLTTTFNKNAFNIEKKLFTAESPIQLKPQPENQNQIIELRKYQKQFINRVINTCRYQKGIILYHIMGSGKTFTALNLLLNFNQDVDFIILCPNDIKNEWIRQINLYFQKKIHFREKVLDNIHDIDEIFKKDKSFFENKILIIDEAHNLLKILRESNNKNLFDILNKNLSITFKNIFMSGTPIYNNSMDINFLINLSNLPNKLDLIYQETDFKKKYMYIPKHKYLTYGYLLPIAFKSVKFMTLFNNIYSFHVNELFNKYIENRFLRFMFGLSKNIAIEYIGDKIANQIKLLIEKQSVDSMFVFNPNKTNDFYNDVHKYIDYFSTSKNNKNSPFATINQVNEFVDYNVFQSTLFYMFIYEIGRIDHILDQKMYILKENIYKEYINNGRQIGNISLGFLLRDHVKEISNMINELKKMSDTKNMTPEKKTEHEKQMQQAKEDLKLFIKQKLHEKYGELTETYLSIFNLISYLISKLCTASSYVFQYFILNKNITDTNIFWPNKFDRLYKKYLNDPEKKRKKHVIYSNYYDYGVQQLVVFFNYMNEVKSNEDDEIKFKILFPNDVLKKLLKNDNDENISKIRHSILDEFHRGVFNVLIIHPDLTEGYSIKSVNYIHILEPIKELSVYDQVIGRVVRMDSHTNNGIDKNVYVINWICTNLEVRILLYNNIVIEKLLEIFVLMKDGTLLRETIKKSALMVDITPDSFVYNTFKKNITFVDEIKKILEKQSKNMNAPNAQYICDEREGKKGTCKEKCRLISINEINPVNNSENSEDLKECPNVLTWKKINPN